VRASLELDGQIWGCATEKPPSQKVSSVIQVKAKSVKPLQYTFRHEKWIT
jgi:hypothetical protein